MRILFLLILLLLNGQILAADFIFNVPVQLDKVVKGIHQAKIQCDVYAEDDDQISIASGYNIQPIYAQQGVLYKEVTVNVNFLPRQRGQTAYRYQCELLLLVPWANPSWQKPSDNSNISAIQPQVQSELVTTVSGLFHNEFNNE